ncbi:hypothetical protein V8E52_008552 [Russula decolorans]
MAECREETLNDGDAAFSTRNKLGHLIDRQGKSLCADFQLSKACASKHHGIRHRCSGCGSNQHGAVSVRHGYGYPTVPDFSNRRVTVPVTAVSRYTLSTQSTLRCSTHSGSHGQLSEHTAVKVFWRATRLSTRRVQEHRAPGGSSSSAPGSGNAAFADDMQDDNQYA